MAFQLLKMHIVSVFYKRNLQSFCEMSGSIELQYVKELNNINIYVMELKQMMVLIKFWSLNV